MAETIIDGAGSGYKMRITPEGAIPVSGAYFPGSVWQGTTPWNTLGSMNVNNQNVQYAVDDALGITPTGTLALAKRDDTLEGLTPAEDDAVELRVDQNGALWTRHNGYLGVTQQGSWIFTANNLDIRDLTSATDSVVGSPVYVDTPAIIGSYTNQNVLGSIAQLTDPWRITGSVISYGVGSVYQFTNPWVVSGNVLISGTAIIANPATIGSYTNQFVLGSVNQSTDPWRITGSTISYGVGSIYGIGIGSVFALVTGSVEIKTNLATIGSIAVQTVGLSGTANTSIGYLNKAYPWATANIVVDTEIIAAAGAGSYTYLKHLFIVNNDNVDGTMKVEDTGGDGNIIQKSYFPAYGGQLDIHFPGKGLKQVTANSAITLDMTTANDWTYLVEYYQDV